MSNYEDIKVQAARIFPLKGMAEAALKQGNTAKAVEYAKQFCDKANEIRATYPDTFAAVVVYMNASEFLARLLSDAGDAHNAYDEQQRCLLAVRDVLVRGLTNENVCQMLLAHVSQSMFVLLDIRGGATLITERQNATELIQLYFNLFYDLYYRLKRINPNNMFIATQGKQIFEAFERMGLSSNVETPINIGGTIDEIGFQSIMLGLFNFNSK